MSTHFSLICINFKCEHLHSHQQQLFLVWPLYFWMTSPERFQSITSQFMCSCFFSTQVRLSDIKSRGGAEAREGPLHQWPALRSVLPGLLGGVGPTRPAVPAVPVSVRRLPVHGGPPPQRPAGRSCRVQQRPHAPQLPLLRVQRPRLILRFSFLLLLGQRGFLLLPSLLRGSRSFFHPGICLCVSITAASFPKGSASKTGRSPGT